MRRVKTRYDSLSQAEFNEFLTYIIQCLTDNAYFPNPTVSLLIIKGKQAEWQKKLKESRQGKRDSTQKAKELQSELLHMVKINGNYINNTANGDVGMLESSGYTLAKERVDKPKAMVRIVQGEQSGAGHVILKKFPHAVTYLAEVAADAVPDPNSDWGWKRLKLSTKRTIRDLCKATVL